MAAWRARGTPLADRARQEDLALQARRIVGHEQALAANRIGTVDCEREEGALFGTLCVHLGSSFALAPNPSTATGNPSCRGRGLLFS